MIDSCCSCCICSRCFRQGHRRRRRRSGKRRDFGRSLASWTFRMYMFKPNTLPRRHPVLSPLRTHEHTPRERTRMTAIVAGPLLGGLVGSAVSHVARPRSTQGGLLRIMIPNYLIAGLLYHLSDDHQPNLVDPFRVSSHIPVPNVQFSVKC